MEVVYCDNCGLTIARSAAHVDGGKIYCAKCAPLYKDTTTAIQKVQLPSKVLGSEEPTGEFAPVVESTTAQNTTKFYFCETCGKRITDRQILEGLGRDKKLKGVYCKDCAVGVMTMEFNAISEADLRKPIRKSDGNAIPVTRESSVESKSVQNVSRAGIAAAARSPTPPQGKSSERIQSAAKREQRSASTIIAGTAAAVFVTVLAIIFATQSSRSSRNDTASTRVNDSTPPPMRAAISTPVASQDNSNLQVSPTKPPVAVEAPQRSDPATTAKVDYDNLTKHLESTVREDIAAKDQSNKSALAPDLPDQQVHDQKPRPPAQPPIAKPVDSGVAVQKMLEQTLKLLSQTDIAAALRSVEQDQSASADARSALKAALETLQKRDTAWREALAKNVGHKVKIETKGGVVEGTVLAVEGEALKIDKPLVINGEVMGSATVAVAFADILPASRDAMAPLPTPDTIDEWMGLALACMAKQDFDAADTALAHSDGHTLQRPFKNLEASQRTTARESKAQVVWKDFESRIAGKLAQPQAKTLLTELTKFEAEFADAAYLKDAILQQKLVAAKEELGRLSLGLDPRIQAAFKGHITSYDPRTQILSVTYDFLNKEQMEDFQTTKCGTLEQSEWVKGGIRISNYEVVSHAVISNRFTTKNLSIIFSYKALKGNNHVGISFYTPSSPGSAPRVHFGTGRENVYCLLSFGETFADLKSVKLDIPTPQSAQMEFNCTGKHYSVKSNGKEIFAYDQKEENDHQGFSVGGGNDSLYTLTSLQITGTLDARWLATLNSKK